MNKTAFINFSLFDSISSMKRERFLFTKFSRLVDIITDQENYAWSPIVWKKDKKRQSKYFENCDLLVLDIDQGCSIDQAKEIFKDYRCLILATKTHQKAKKIKGIDLIADRYRVIIPFQASISSLAIYRATMSKVQKEFPFIDSACLDPARLFFPCQKEILFINLKGKDWPLSAASDEHIAYENTLLCGVDPRLLKGFNGHKAVKSAKLPKFKENYFWMRSEDKKMVFKRSKEIILVKSPEKKENYYYYYWYPSSTFSFNYEMKKGFKVKESIKEKIWKEEGLLSIMLKGEYQKEHWDWLHHLAIKIPQGYRLWLPYSFLAVKKISQLKELISLVKAQADKRGFESLKFVVSNHSLKPDEEIALIPSEILMLQKKLKKFLFITDPLMAVKEILSHDRKEKRFSWSENQDISLYQIKEKFKWTHEIPSFFKDLSRCKENEDLFKAFFSHPSFSRFFFGSKEDLTPVVSSKILAELASNIRGREVHEKTAQRFLKNLVNKKLIEEKEKPKGGIKARTYSLSSSFYQLLQQYKGELIRDKKIYKEYSPASFLAPPEDGEFNNYIFKATRFFSSLEEMIHYFSHHHESFMNEKQERWMQLKKAWASHEKRKKNSLRAS